MRIVKEHDERKNEIIDTSALLFESKGYEECSVNDILNAIGIAKGTFYHYFKSKEEVLDAVIAKITEAIVDRVREVAADGAMTPGDKLLQAFLSMRVKKTDGDSLLQELHQPENIRMHQKSLVSMVTALTPILSDIVEQGNQSGEFCCPYPKQYMQILLSSALTLLDEGIFAVEPESEALLFEALMTLLEKMLGVAKGSIKEAALQYWQF